MVSKKEKYVIEDFISRSQTIKYKYNYMLEKSLTRNFFLKRNLRLFISLNRKKRLNGKRVKNICLMSGENNAIRKYFLVSRFKLNALSVRNSLNNFRLNS